MEDFLRVFATIYLRIELFNDECDWQDLSMRMDLLVQAAKTH